MRAFTAVMRDPGVQVRACASAMHETGNPFFAWEAIQICIERGREFPDWVLVYLRQSADRMQSPKARQAQDLRSVLPWVFNFPKKSGPGSLLNPDPDPYDRSLLAIKFAIRIEKGEKPFEALRNACNDTLPPGRADTIDDKTLRGWMVKEFRTKEFFRTRAAWQAVARKYYRNLYRSFEELSREIAS
jgi:hypothetical protein